MHIIWGSDKDVSNIVSEKPLQINSCGINTTYKRTHSINRDFMVSRPEGRLDYQLLYMISGKGDYYLNGTWKTIREGHVVIYKPNEPQAYRFRAQVPLLCRWIHFSGTQVPLLLSGCGLDKKQVFETGVCPDVDALLEGITREIQRKPPMYQSLINAYFQQALALLGRYMIIRRNQEEYQNHQRLMDIVEHINRHYDEPQKIESFADRCGMSKYHFIRAFKENVGQSPYAYLIHIRIQRAKELLLTEGLSISEIAVACGYENPLYFSRAFTKYVKVSPSVYRRAHKQES